MKKIVLSVACAVSAFCSPSWAQETTLSKPSLQKITPDALWKLGRVGLEDISRDGQKVLYGVTTYDLAANKGDRNLFVVDAKSGTVKALTSLPGSETEAVFLRGGSLVGFMYQGQLWTVSMDGTEPIQRTEFPNGVGNVKILERKDGRLLMVFTASEKLDKSPSEIHPDLPKADFALYDDLMYRHWDQYKDASYDHMAFASVDLSSTEKVKEFTDAMKGEKFDSPVPPMGGSDAYTISPEGRYIAYVSKKKTGIEFALSTNSALYLFDRETGTTLELPGQPGYESAPQFSPDGSVLSFLSMPMDGYESDVNQLHMLSLRGPMGMGKNAVRLLDEEYIESYQWVDATTLVYNHAFQGTQQLVRLELTPALHGEAPAVKKRIPLTSGNYNYGAFKAAQGTIVAERQDMNHANELFTVAWNGTGVKPLTRVNEGANATTAQSKIEKRWIKTTDGKQLLTWVIFPPDFDSTKTYPTLLYCQGGPQSAVSQFFSFRWNFQLMAARGYIVVAPNRRGVPGFGKEWNEAISKDWGGQAMQDYLSAIDAVAAEPYVNKEALGAVGASYGGYSVYLLAGIHEGRFKAFISHCGLFDLKSWYLTTEELFFANYDIGGSFWSPAPPISYDLHNPINYVDRWTAPLLVIHGGKDFRVPENQGMEAYQAAQLRGIPSKFLYFPNEGHWVLRPQNGLVWHREFYSWLDQWLQP